MYYRPASEVPLAAVLFYATTLLNLVVVPIVFIHVAWKRRKDT